MLENSFEIDSFLDDDEIIALLRFYKTLPKTANSGDFHAYTTGFPWNDLPMETIKKEIQTMVSFFLNFFKINKKGTVNKEIHIKLNEYVPITDKI